MPSVGVQVWAYRCGLVAEPSAGAEPPGIFCKVGPQNPFESIRNIAIVAKQS